MSETVTRDALLPRVVAAICVTVTIVAVVRWVFAAMTGRDLLAGRIVDQPLHTAWSNDVGPDDLAG